MDTPALSHGQTDKQPGRLPQVGRDPSPIARADRQTDNSAHWLPHGHTCKLPLHGEAEGGLLPLGAGGLQDSLQRGHQDLLVGGCHCGVVGAGEGPVHVQGQEGHVGAQLVPPEALQVTLGAGGQHRAVWHGMAQARNPKTTEPQGQMCCTPVTARLSTGPQQPSPSRQQRGGG